MPDSQARSEKLHGRAQGLPSNSGEGQIIQVGPDRLEAATARLVAGGGPPDTDHARRFLSYAGQNEIDLSLMWSHVDRRDIITATMLAVPGAGRTAMLFMSRPGGRGDIPTVSRLLEHGCRVLPDHDVELAQALMDPSETLERDALLGADFFELATLQYLARSVPRSGAAPAVSWPDDVTIESYRPDLKPIVLDLLEESYVDTQDCPNLCGLRRTEDIFAGHYHTGRFDPDLWTILSVNGEPGGVLMLNPCQPHDTIELVYIGLAPKARGRGLGRQLLRHGLTQIAGRGEALVTLAVDEKNDPALALYKREGFRRELKRVALIRSLRRSHATEE